MIFQPNCAMGILELHQGVFLPDSRNKVLEAMTTAHSILYTLQVPAGAATCWRIADGREQPAYSTIEDACNKTALLTPAMSPEETTA